MLGFCFFFFFSSRRRHTRSLRDWSSDVCSSDLALKKLAVYGRADWFNLGDQDLATHIHRSALLEEGKTLSEIAESIRTALGVKTRILPMSDNPVPTIIESNEGAMHFQKYLVKRRAEPVVVGIRFAGVEQAQPAPGVLEAIREAGRIFICPSNPFISIGPILAVPGVRQQLRSRKRDVFAVCPIVGGKSLKGPHRKDISLARARSEEHTSE